jgi:TruB family pseudouridylate synthase (N terminal domain)
VRPRATSGDGGGGGDQAAPVSESVPDEALLDSLYSADEGEDQCQQQRAAAAAATRGSPLVCAMGIIDDAGVAANRSADDAALEELYGGDASLQAAGQPPPVQQQQQQTQQVSADGGAVGAAGSVRAAPMRVPPPSLPKDLGVFSNAVLLVDKPVGWTSFDACNAIKKAVQKLGVKKVGHAGTLDPAATGLLIICTGAGTKSIEGFMGAPKEYSGTLKLGEGTPSLDAETPVEERLPWDHITGACAVCLLCCLGSCLGSCLVCCLGSCLVCCLLCCLGSCLLCCLVCLVCHLSVTQSSPVLACAVAPQTSHLLQVLQPSLATSCRCHQCSVPCTTRCALITQC